CSAFRRRQNLYAKTVDGLERALSVQRLIHNWVRSHWSSGQTPAMAMGFIARPVRLSEMLSLRGLHDLPP
ncbi:MAG: IS1 family transposase, partial [Geitlerinemataceae cyanobacterium]